MILDIEILKEVIEAIGAETSQMVIKMFQEQSPILVAGAMNGNTPTTDRAEALHALKGMAEQLGLKHLSRNCVVAEEALLNAAPAETVLGLVRDVEDCLATSQSEIIKYASQLIDI